MGFCRSGLLRQRDPHAQHRQDGRPRALRFAQFYNMARCCPTRASIMTGLYPHQAGIGHDESEARDHIPAYEGELNSDHCVTSRRSPPRCRLSHRNGRQVASGSSVIAQLPRERGQGRARISNRMCRSRPAKPTGRATADSKNTGARFPASMITTIRTAWFTTSKPSSPTNRISTTPISSPITPCN